MSYIQENRIPIIDISSAVNGCSLTANDKLIVQIKEACKNWGFFQVVNHGVPLQQMKAVEIAAREFFALPVEEKQKVMRNENNPLGYYDSEHTKNVRDWKEIFDFTAQDPTLIPASHEIDDEKTKELRNQWPDYPSEFRSTCEDYSDEMLKLSFKLLELIALSLNLSADHLNGFFKDHTGFIRLNYYPPCPFPDQVLGVGQHKDGGALTVLSQDDTGGLEVKRKTDGQWILVNPVPNALVVNVGDVIQVLSPFHSRIILKI